MATEFIFQIENQPGALAASAESLSNAGINIEGIAGVSTDGKGLIHLVTNNVEGTMEALGSAGVSFDQQEVLLLKMPNESHTH